MAQNRLRVAHGRAAIILVRLRRTIIQRRREHPTPPSIRATSRPDSIAASSSARVIRDCLTALCIEMNGIELTIRTPPAARCAGSAPGG